jgi:hypothetical protein
MKKKTRKLGELQFKGCLFEIKEIKDEHEIMVEYQLIMRWREYSSDGWISNRQKLIGKYNYLQDVVAKLNEIVQYNSREEMMR